MPQFNLESLLPRINLRDDANGDLSTFVNTVLQPVVDLLLADMQLYIDQGDVDIARADTVDAMLSDLGNPYSIILSQPLNRQRLLIRVLVQIYRSRGTKDSISEVIRAVTGIEIVQVVCPAATSGWILDEQVLGEDENDPLPTDMTLTDYAFFGDGAIANGRSFQVEVDFVLTTEEKEILTEVIRLTKPVGTHFVGFIEPGGAPAISHPDLGYSYLHKTGESLLGDELDLED